MSKNVSAAPSKGAPTPITPGEWRAIPAFPSYAASQEGLILGKTGRVLRPGRSRNGYQHVILRHEGRGVTQRVHRLVAQAWLPNPENKREVNHKNGIKTDNRVVNLEWTTTTENKLHGFATGLLPRGSACSTSKLTEEQVLDIRRRHYKTPQAVLAKEYGVSGGLIANIHLRRNWAWVPEEDARF